MSFIVIMLATATFGRVLLAPVRLGRVASYVYRGYIGLAVCAIVALSVGAYSLRVAEFLLYVVAGCGLVHQIYRRFRPKIEEPVRVRQDLDSRTIEVAVDAVETPDHAPFSRLERIAMAVLIAAITLTLVSALSPATSWDAATAHMALPADYARDGRVHFVEGNTYTAYPHLLHGLFGLAYLHGGEASVGLVSWTFGVLGCGALYVLGTALGSRETGLLAAAILGVSPIFFDQAGTAALDVPFAGCAVASIAALVLWREAHESRPLLILAGVMIGISCGMRHTGFLVAVLLALGVLFASRERRLEYVSVFALSAAFGAYPWLLRTAFVVGNPVFPFLREVFPTPYLPDIQTTLPGAHETVRGYSVWSAVVFPWNVIMRPDHFDGWPRSPGGLVLILGVPGALLCGRYAQMIGAFSLAGIYTLAIFQRFARYCLPFFAPLMAVAALSATSLPRVRKGLVPLVLASLAYGLVLGVAMLYYKVPSALGLVSKQEYLAQRIERYAGFEWVNRNVDPAYTVFTLDPRTLYIHAPTYANPAILPTLAEFSPDELMTWFRVRKIRYLFYPKLYIQQSPAFRARGYTDVIDAWRRDDAHFRLMDILSVPRPRTGGAERIEIYEILYGSLDGNGAHDEPA